ncbi:DNA-3-methyladenine glycosylase II [Lentibacillus persicus]|uniref:DNA-3-methyladenine glycosylase II n=1 Tax=Lentibacillus persicus TaxID=640948 RepID=A0A1I1SS02_9BACI|nr:DNA-3-methyladenine glycosylase [Lentibacillus persicus]SFD45850.1 DNA-3-methyladenine glycosylase II [Lentibacillus persicus]
MKTFTIKKQDRAAQELSTADSQMKKLINIVGDITVSTRPEYFKSLVRAIVGQQISVQAASTIFSRLEELLDNRIKSDSIMTVTDEQLRSIGFSRQKIQYLRDLTAKANDGSLDFTRINDLTNTEAIKELTQIKGIGKWTAEMFLIFSLGRMNVLAVDDIGIQRGAKWLYQVEKSERRQILIDKKPIWTPHLTIASFYLWEVVHLGFDKAYSSIDELI